MDNSTVLLLDFHVGNLIISFLKKNNISQAHLAKELGMATPNLNRLLKRESMDTNQILEISEKLNHNFFADISGDEEEGKSYILIHAQIGNHIETRLKELKMTQSHFASLLNVTPAEVSRLIRKESFDAQKLLKISRILNYDFFRDFYQYVQEENKDDGWTALMKRNEELAAENALLKKKVESQRIQIEEFEKDLGTKFDTSFSNPIIEIKHSFPREIFEKLKKISEKYNIDFDTFLYLMTNKVLENLSDEDFADENESADTK